MHRRKFLETCAAAGAIAALNLQAQTGQASQSNEFPSDLGPEAIVLPDDGWNLWIDEAARWQDDEIFLPHDVDLKKLTPRRIPRYVRSSNRHARCATVTP